MDKSIYFSNTFRTIHKLADGFELMEIDNEKLFKFMDVSFLLITWFTDSNKYSLIPPRNLLICENGDRLRVFIAHQNTTYEMNDIRAVYNEVWNIEDANKIGRRELGYTYDIYIDFFKSDILKYLESFNSIIKVKDFSERYSKICEIYGNDSDFSEFLERLITPYQKQLYEEEHKMNFDPIFKARNLVVDEKLIFGILQFDDTRKGMFDDFIRPKLEESFGLTVIRSGNIFDSNIDIMENIWTYINKARIIICDLSGKNPNVFYELGIANTIGKDVIPICDKQSYHQDYNDKLPFDIVTRNVLFYENTAVGAEKFIKELKNTVEATITGHSVLSFD